MYAFPQIRLPEPALAAAAEAGLSPDVFYSLELLEATGVCVVPGSGFGQEPGTFHFRTTILPPEDRIGEVISRMSTFNDSFMERFSEL